MVSAYHVTLPYADDSWRSQCAPRDRGALVEFNSHTSSFLCHVARNLAPCYYSRSIHGGGQPSVEEQLRTRSSPLGRCPSTGHRSLTENPKLWSTVAYPGAWRAWQAWTVVGALQAFWTGPRGSSDSQRLPSAIAALNQASQTTPR